MNYTRRDFVRRGAAAGAGLSLTQLLLACNDGEQNAPTTTAGSSASGAGGYGELVEASGALMLPAGFSYVSFGRAGSEMSDGLQTPTCHDGSAAFAGANRDTVIHVRNHEGFRPGRAFGPDRAYDPVAQGGVVVSHFNTAKGALEGSALVLNGTDNNCNGGATPWGTWLSGEESTVGRGRGFEREHGYMFEVPIDSREPVEPLPLKAMGRFVHEAAPVDPRTGIVYLTEDNGEPGDGFYRFLPRTRGKLQRGGELEMLRVKGRPGYDTEVGQKVGEKLECDWVPIREPDPSDAEKSPEAVYMQGADQGGARFLGLEGAFFRDGAVVFTASESGDAGQGQVWSFRPDPRNHDRGELTLLFESPSRAMLNQPDGITVSPRGGILMAEDGDGEDRDGGDNWLRGLTPEGELFDFAKNVEPLPLGDEFVTHLFPLDEAHWTRPSRVDRVGASEFSGVTFSPDGRWLFANLQYPGETFAITGPWEKGAL